ncbi:MAG: enoyl-CoA hydratase/isomerase family protein [Desulfatitalea sp.]|nr:enoyl-CoA hydratase/isomerase family protein [Desulfatitalea sp.]
MEDTVVTLEIEGPVATIRLNRPEVMNAFNFDMLRSLSRHLDTLRFDPAIRVVIITGAGKAFSAGADLKERAGMTPEQVRAFIFQIRRLMDDVEQFNKPIIAAVNGVALGGGTELALAADIRIAAESATMGLTETRLAIIPGAGGTQRLPRLVGKGIAKEMIFTGRRIDAQEAMRIGLVNQVHPPEALMGACQRLAEEICASGPIAVEQAKYAINRGLETDLNTGLAIESNAYWICIPTEDRLEGLTAFREKRKPIYKGK